MTKLLVAALAALALAPVAEAGCWAEVTLSSMPTSRVWNVKVTPLQHGVTPLPNAKPRIEIRRGSGAWKVFVARRTVKSGVFRARVVFPSTGKWQLRVWDGFEPMCARYHRYAAVTIRDV
jgi:hypothetical protein